MSEKEPSLNSKNIELEKQNTKVNKPINDQQLIKQSPNQDSTPKWINNKGEEVKEVFGFNENAELVNGRVAMIGFLMLLLTELAFAGNPVTQSIFGIN